jgi:CBS domain-containing protein
MKCSEVMNKNVETLNEQDSVQKAALVMAETGVGFLPICDARMHVIGVVTDRDLTTRALAKKIAPETTSAALIMTSPALTCLATADVREAEELMAKERKARLIIVNADGRLAGVLSLADLVEHAPGRQTLQTVSAVLWRDALGPRGGAARNQPLLKDDPVACSLPVPSDDLKVRPSVFTGGNRNTNTKEFPG